MAKKKSKRKAAPKAKIIVPLDTQFNCPFCNYELVCEVKMDRVRKIGLIECRNCKENFTTSITYLSEPIDIYNEWVDACEAANN